MIKRIIRNNMRRPLYSVAVMLFAAVLAVVLCYLCKAGQEEQRSFEESYASVPVFFKVTDLYGAKPTNYEGINGWIVELFTDDDFYPTLMPYVKELHLRASYTGETYDNAFLVRWVYVEELAWNMKRLDPLTVTGVTSTYVAEELTEAWGGKIYWNEGYDESILASDELVCLVPHTMKERQELEIEFWHKPDTDKMVQEDDLILPCTFTVVGYYEDSGNSTIYCPYEAMQWVHAKLGKAKTIENLGAILNDNNALPELREAASKWFAEPNALGTKTPWGRFGYEYYIYALSIDDVMLRNLETNMKNSVRLNQIASAVVFALSAGAGFLTGFLVIRSRKREIALMRTMGASHPSIFMELALEQCACIVLGIVLGGSYTLWQPIGRLCLFGTVFCVGLTTALLVFLRKNLLASIKEEE